MESSAVPPSGTQTIKAELGQAKIAIEQARRVGDLARMWASTARSLSWKNT
ncbi:hypothetical protein ACNKHS_15825 [Shigella flexneri]